MTHRIVVPSLLAGLSLLFSSCSVNKAEEQKGPPPIPVSAVEVRAGEATYHDDYPATVVALNQVDLRAQVSGYITDIFVKDGQRVSQGMKLYAIDRRQYQAAYDQAVANLNVARANEAKAQQDADRYADLARNDAIARQTLEHAQADLEASKMQVAAAEATVNSVETNLHYSVITAPFDGTVGISQVKLGSAVGTGQTVLNTISSDDPIAVDCAVDEKLISRFTTLLQSAENGKDSTFMIVLPDQSVYPFTGRLNFLDRAVDPQTGTIKVRVVFPNSRRQLRAGLTCDLRVRTTGTSTTVLIPYKAVTEQMGEYFVFVVNDVRVTQRRIHLGMTIDDQVIVQSGLEPGDKIVTEGMQRLRDNAPVAVTLATPAPHADTRHGL